MRGSSTLCARACVSKLCMTRSLAQICGTMAHVHGDVVAHGQQAAIPALRPPAIQRGKQIIQPRDLDLVEAVEESPRDEAHTAHDGHGAEPPRQRLAHRRGGSRTGHGFGRAGVSLVSYRRMGFGRVVTRARAQFAGG